MVASRTRACVCLLALLASACGQESSSETRTDTPSSAVDETPSPGREPTPVEPEPPPPVPLPPSRIETRGPYQAEVGQLCDGLPALAVETAEGLCVGLVIHTETPAIDAARGRFRPRGITHDPNRTDTMWVIDHGARRPRAGRVWRLRKQGEAWVPRSFFRRLDRPHGGRVGPDGWIYVGEIQRIFRFDPAAEDPVSTREIVVDGMPVVGWNERPVRFHPLTSFVFNAAGDLIVNMGSATDRCLESADTPRCHDEADRTAALWRYARTGERSWSSTPEVYARGLRNSVALAAHPSGTLLQGENGVDFRDANSPEEELNVIVEGQHYGWPYCFDAAGRDPDWTHAPFVCDDDENPRYTAPHRFLPPHGAPLGMAYYATGLEALEGRLLISFHGYRPTGHRVLSLPVDDDGVPSRDAPLETVIAGWDASDRGPRGSPVEMALAADGSVWLTEDTNGTVLRLAGDAYAGRRGDAPEDHAAAPNEAEPEFVVLQREVLIPRCSPCHEYAGGEPNTARQAVEREGWLRRSDGRAHVETRIAPNATRPMPPTGPLTAGERAHFDAWLEAAN
ncbi:MAG: sorbosone dehydrogenase family protein [Sandaracinaceae bacterium]